MARKPSMRQAEWIAKRMEEETNVDDVFDVLTGQIINPISFVQEVEYWSNEYNKELNGRTNAR